ncbi:hypothetical protein MHYP_G00299640 [Metynnis hypsauchen]
MIKASPIIRHINTFFRITLRYISIDSRNGAWLPDGGVAAGGCGATHSPELLPRLLKASSYGCSYHGPSIFIKRSQVKNNPPEGYGSVSSAVGIEQT